MKCPKCGCKIHKQIMCPYCKITGDEVRFASNKEAKRRIKEKNTKEVYNSTYLPYDVDRRKLTLITIFGGFFGFDLHYLGRYKSAIIQFAIIILAFIFVVMTNFFGYSFIKIITEVLTLISTIYLMIWFTKIFNILVFKKANIPVVLPTKIELKDRIVAKTEAEKLYNEKKENRKSAKYNKLVEKGYANGNCLVISFNPLSADAVKEAIKNA